MVEQSILNYLKEGVSRGFSVDRLKEELLKNNFNATEIDEAIKTMNPVKPLPVSYQSSYPMRILEEKKGRKWMLIAGIIGIIMFILGMIGFGFSVWNVVKASSGVPMMSPAQTTLAQYGISEDMVRYYVQHYNPTEEQAALYIKQITGQTPEELGINLSEELARYRTPFYQNSSNQNNSVQNSSNQNSSNQNPIIPDNPRAATAADIIGFPVSLPIAIAILAISLLLFILFYYGFVRMGRYTDSSLLTDSSWGIMFAPLIFGVVIAIAYFVIIKIVESLLANTVTFGFGTIPDFTSVKTLVVVLFGVWIAALVFYLIMQILFSIGLMQAGKQVRFAKIGGILNIIYIILSTGALIYLAVIFYSVYQLFASGEFIGMAISGINPLSNFISPMLNISYVTIAVELLGLFGTLFASLALFEASKKFE